MTELQTRTKYQYDAEGRLISVNGVAGEACQSTWLECMTYNALGQRVEWQWPSSSTTQDYVYGAAGEEVGEFNPSTGHWSRYTLWVAGQRVYVFSNSDYRMFHANALKSATMTTDQTGAVIEDQIFYPWGQKWYDEGTSTGYRFFAGMKQQDWKTGNDPALHRDYNPGLGRWLTPDPGGMKVIRLDNPQTWNLYAYVTNNPETFNDPLGLFQDHLGPGGKNCDESTGGGACHYGALTKKTQAAVLGQAIDNPPPPPHWQYHQKSGTVDLKIGSVEIFHVGTGYAGHGKGLDNPDYQHVRGKNAGPPPQGKWRLGRIGNYKERNGRVLKNAMPMPRNLGPIWPDVPEGFTCMEVITTP